MKEENPLLHNHLSLVRILANRPETCSFLLRLGMSSNSSCEQLLERGRLSVDYKLLAVVEADPLEEIIRHALVARTTVTCPPFAKRLQSPAVNALVLIPLAPACFIQNPLYVKIALEIKPLVPGRAHSTRRPLANT